MHPQGRRIGLGQAGGGAIGIGQQRIVGGSRRQRALGRAEDDRDIDVEADRATERADGDAVADPPDPTGRGIEFALERGAEAVPGDRLADRVEVAQPVERGGERLPGPVFDLRESLEASPTDPERRAGRRTTATIRSMVVAGWGGRGTSGDR